MSGVAQQDVPELSPEEAAILEDAPFSKDAYRVCKRMLSQRVGKKRLEHSVNVAKVARELAKLYGADPDKARLAGILHDWDKDLSNKQAVERAVELGVDVDPMVLTDMPWLLHGPTAAAALKRDFPQFGDDVFRAISLHTSGAADMSPLDAIIYVADIIEPNRTFGDLDAIARLRTLVGEVPLDELYFQSFKYTLEFLVSHDRVLYPATIEAWNILMRTHGYVTKKGIDIWSY